MSSIDLKKSKKIDERSQLIVCGYLRMIQNSTKQYSSFNINIPPIINSICLLYFYTPPFESHADCIKISGEKENIATKYGKDATWSSIYGSQWIESNIPKIYKFTFKYISFGKFNSILLCFVTNKHHFDITKFVRDKHSYLFNTSGTLTDCNKNLPNQAKIKIKRGDMVDFILNLNDFTIQVQKKTNRIQKYYLKILNMVII